MPFFSIVIPSYNRADFITATINSVLNQVFNDFELIIVDDGSTDNTGELIRNNFTNNSKIKYVWHANGERAAARNKGIRMASGRYVVFLDSDDLMLPECLAILYRNIVEQNFPNFIAAKHFLRKDGKDSYSASLKLLKQGYYDINLQLKGSVFACNFAMKRDNPSLHLFPEDRKYSTHEDWLFIIQNLVHDRIYLVDKYLIVMNDHNDRSMRKDNADIINKHLEATAWIENHISLTAFQKKILWGYSFQFCAIHSYIDGKRSATFQYLIKSIKLIGIDKVKSWLLLKNIIGYKRIQHLKG